MDRRDGLGCSYLTVGIPAELHRGGPVAFKGGFLGGPTFPAIFASTCVALAISLVFPGLRADVLIGGVMAGFLMVLFRAPLMASC